VPPPPTSSPDSGSLKYDPRKVKSKKLSPNTFLQHDAVTETLLSHCQISAPLLKMFPLSLQRALVGNVLTVVTATVKDGCDGFRLRILGCQLTLNFKAMGAAESIRWLGGGGGGGGRRQDPPRRTSSEFEVAVTEISTSLYKELKFLDRWHEKLLGGVFLRTQIANLIARLVLTLVDDCLGGLKLDLWSEGGGPRVLAGIEIRKGGEV
jgi:hypothetical protein